MKEKPIENEILEYLNAVGFKAFNIQSQGQYNAKRGRWIKRKSKFKANGHSDIVCWIGNGKTVYIEVKSPERKNNQSEDQKQFEKDAIKYGHKYLIAFSLKCVVDFFKSNFF